VKKKKRMTCTKGGCIYRGHCLVYRIDDNGKKGYIMNYNEMKCDKEFFISHLPEQIEFFMKRNRINDNGFLYKHQRGYEEVLKTLSLKELDQLWMTLINEEPIEHYYANQEEEFINWYENDSQPSAGPDAWRKLRDYKRAQECVNKHYTTVSNILELLSKDGDVREYF
jgi:hypothetical protein